MDPDRSTYPEDGPHDYLYTTQPPISIRATHADHPDGWTECHIARKNSLAVEYHSTNKKSPTAASLGQT